MAVTDRTQRDAIGDLLDQQLAADVVMEPFAQIFGELAGGKRIRVTPEIMEIEAIDPSAGGKVCLQSI